MMIIIFISVKTDKNNQTGNFSLLYYYCGSGIKILLYCLLFKSRSLNTFRYCLFSFPMLTYCWHTNILVQFALFFFINLCIFTRFYVHVFNFEMHNIWMFISCSWSILLFICEICESVFFWHRAVMSFRGLREIRVLHDSSKNIRKCALNLNC